jgi:hypothetical protein
MASQEAATQLYASAIFLGLFWLNAVHAAAPVSKKTIRTLSFGLTLSPGAKTAKSSLQVVIETVQRLSISCGIISWLCCRGDTSLVSSTMGEISFCCIALLMDSWPVFASMSVCARLILLNPGPAFFLASVVPFAVVAEMVVL